MHFWLNIDYIIDIKTSNYKEWGWSIRIMSHKHHIIPQNKNVYTLAQGYVTTNETKQDFFFTKVSNEMAEIRKTMLSSFTYLWYLSPLLGQFSQLEAIHNVQY